MSVLKFIYDFFFPGVLLCLLYFVKDFKLLLICSTWRKYFLSTYYVFLGFRYLLKVSVETQISHIVTLTAAHDFDNKCLKSNRL